jgi:hypothetical protein
LTPDLSPSRRRLTVAGLISLAAVLAAIGFVRPAPANAYVLEVYCNILTPPTTTCNDEPTYRSWAFNHAEYDGSGTVNVCEHTYGPEYNTVSRRCNNNVVGSATDLDYYFAHGFYLHLKCGNNSAYSHTIYCWGNT